MSQYSESFNKALLHAMRYEVGQHFTLTPEVIQGLCETPGQRRATGYVNDPLDAGGETKFGIAKNANPTLNIKALTWAQAEAVYYNKYWLAAQCDRLNDISPSLTVLHFDGAVNHGITNAARFLQRSIGVIPDGVIGPVTLQKLRVADERLVLNSICDAREIFYRAIVKQRPNQSRFLNGWLRRINEMRAFVLST